MCQAFENFIRINQDTVFDDTKYNEVTTSITIKIDYIAKGPIFLIFLICIKYFCAIGFLNEVDTFKSSSILIY